MAKQHRKGASARPRPRTSPPRRNDPDLAGPDPAPGTYSGVAGETGFAIATSDPGVGSGPGPVALNDGLSVLTAVPTRGNPWYETANALSGYNPQYIREKLSVASVRNRIVREFLKTKAEALCMVDDDVIPPDGFLEMLAGCPYDVVGAPVPIAKMPAHPVFINVFDVREDGGISVKLLPETGNMPCDAIGSGVILIHRRVLEHPDLKRPFEQLLDPDGVILVGQDLRFCQRVREAGFSIGVCMDAMCDHFVSLHAGAISEAYSVAFEDKLEALKARGVKE